MIDVKEITVLAFLSVSLVLISLPFLPAYLEWKYPSDSASLPVFSHYENDVDHFAKRLRADVSAKLGQGTPTGYEEFDFVPKSLGNMAWSQSEKRLISCGSIETQLSICCQQALYVDGSIKTGMNSVFSALYATGDIELDSQSKVLNWAHADGIVQLGTNSKAFRRISAGIAVVMEEGAWFERINAPIVEFGSTIRIRSKSSSQNSKQTRPAQTVANLIDVNNVVQKTPSLYYVRGDCDLVDDAIYHGSLIVTGTLTIGSRTIIIGDVKARKGLQVRSGASVMGAVTCEKCVHVYSDASIVGPLLSERDIVLDLNATIGLIEAPTSISGQNILVSDGVVVHGSIWAHEIGMVRQTCA